MLFRSGYLCMVALTAGGLLFAGCQTRSEVATSEDQRTASGLTAAPASGLTPFESNAVLAGIPDTESEALVEAHAHYGTALIHEMNGEAVEALNEYYEAASRDLGNESLIL